MSASTTGHRVHALKDDVHRIVLEGLSQAEHFPLAIDERTVVPLAIDERTVAFVTYIKTIPRYKLKCSCDSNERTMEQQELINQKIQKESQLRHRP